ncbi:MAG: tubulin-like doman-containing protein [Eubacterium sp.]|nr:tubulin-like doman-containing protein [Eubacterium sp.]
MDEVLKKEKTTETLFVGVGGIGSDIISEVAAMCAVEELENLRFVALDTDANSLKKVKDTNVEITKVQTSSSQTVKEYLDKDDNARLFWFPNNSTLYGKTVSEGAGQVRAISRLALNNAIRTGEINKLYKEIDNLLLKDSGNFKQALRVVVVSSATGGTGSGMAMITAMLIREYLKDHYSEKKAIIRGFFVLPSVMDVVIDSQMEKNSQYRNGYATIKEINAFMMIGSGFGETEEQLKRYNDIHISIPTPTGENRKLSCLPFDFCFLLEAADKNVEGMDNLQQYKEAAALSIYEQSIGPMQEKSFSLEDNIVKEFGAKEKFGRNRFGGIGASKIIYPYKEIINYIAYYRTLNRIGGLADDQSSDAEKSTDWYKYDRIYELEWEEYKKSRGTHKGEEPDICTSYVDAIQRDKSLFGSDIQKNLGMEDISDVKTVEDAITAYENSLIAGVTKMYTEQSQRFRKVQRISKGNILEEGETGGTARKAYEDLGHFLRDELQSDLDRSVRNIAKMLFEEANQSIRSNDVQEYHLEYLLKHGEGGVHPVAARYLLYKLKINLKQKLIVLKGQREDKLKKVNKYFDTSNENGEELSMDKLSKELKSENLKKAEETEKRDSFNEISCTAAKALLSYMDLCLKYKTFDRLDKYITQLADQYKQFFQSFQYKKSKLTRMQEDIVGAFENVKGISQEFLCTKKEYLDELCNRVPEGKHGFLLPDELSGDIFESVKKNAEFNRLKNNNPYMKGALIDIFDQTIISHFVKEVKEDSKDLLDINVIQAALLEEELKNYLEKKKYNIETDDAEELDQEAQNNKRIALLNELIRKGMKLASPGVNGQSFVEPRDVKICSYNPNVANMRDIKWEKFVQKHKIQSIPSSAVSKYEIRFFNAIYNISPDDIPLFKGPKRDKTSGEVDHSAEGIYFKAYQSYGRLIGPDSTKTSTISTHIDKRWDAVVCLPEINFGVQYDEMLQAHSALMYGLLFELLRKFPSSQYDKKKMIFKLINEEGGRIDLSVSNGTECDEFYEVLDVLYRDKASANMILKVAEEYSRTDVEKNNNYMQSAFFEFLDSFRIPGSHNGKTSLFEVPLVYYNSLPSSMTDTNELSIMIDSVIHIISLAVNRHEREQDRNAYICKLLMEQYDIFIESFSNDEYDKKYNLRKNTNLYDNIVASMVCSKIINKLKEVEISDYSEKVKKLRKAIAIPDDFEEDRDDE